jgi:16S rRNA (guanine527-N7)-methyltransferase
MDPKEGRGDRALLPPRGFGPAPAGPPEERELAEARVAVTELEGLGIHVPPAIEQGLALYLRRIRQWNERINLVSAADVERLGRRHLIESFNILACRIPLSGTRLADAGSGAGFPGIPLALVEPDLRVLLIESVRKKAAFLSQVVDELGLAHPHGSAAGRVDSAGPPAGAASAGQPPVAPPPEPRVAVAAERAEALAATRGHHGSYGIVTVRGFGPLSRAVRECGDLVAPGGSLVAFKGSEPEREIREALGTIKAHGLVLTDIVPLRWGEGRLVLLRRIEADVCSS